MFKNILPLIATCFLFSSYADLENTSSDYADLENNSSDYADLENNDWINSEITYTISNQTDRSWEGNILTFITDTDNITDSYSVHSQAIDIYPKSQITQNLDITRNNTLSTKDNIIIELTQADAVWTIPYTITWTNLHNMNYPGLKEINSIQCIISKDNKTLMYNLNCNTQ